MYKLTLSRSPVMNPYPSRLFSSIFRPPRLGTSTSSSSMSMDTAAVFDPVAIAIRSRPLNEARSRDR